MRAGERAELRELREEVVKRIDELSRSVEQEIISEEEKEHLLQQEYGADYQATLAQINELLHQPPPKSPLLDKRLPAFVGGLLLAALIITIASNPAITAAVTASNAQTLSINETLGDGQATRIAHDERLEIHSIQLEATSAKQYELTLEDTNGRHAFYTQTLDEATCTGCEKSYRPPLMLSAQTDGGEVRINSITYREAEK